MSWYKRQRSVFPDVFGMNKALRQLDRDLYGRYGLVTVAVKIGRCLYKDYQKSHRIKPTNYYSYNSLGRVSKFESEKPKPNRKEYIKDIENLESLLARNEISLNQCERLANIYGILQDYHNERRMRLVALELFLAQCDMSDLFPKIVEAFNDPCKQPPLTITNNRVINEDYKILLRKAEIAKKKSHQFKKLHRL